MGITEGLANALSRERLKCKALASARRTAVLSRKAAFYR